MKPNAFSAELKLQWLNELEGKIATEIMLMAPPALQSLRLRAEDTPMVDPPYDSIYRSWLVARIDQANGEYEEYGNSYAIFDNEWRRFLRWFCQRYDPVQGYKEEYR